MLSPIKIIVFLPGFFFLSLAKRRQAYLKLLKNLGDKGGWGLISYELCQGLTCDNKCYFERMNENSPPHI